MRKPLSTLAAFAICALFTAPAMAGAQEPSKGVTVPQGVSQATVSPGGFIFPPPSGQLDGTVNGGTRGIHLATPSTGGKSTKRVTTATGSTHSVQ